MFSRKTLYAVSGLCLIGMTGIANAEIITKRTTVTTISPESRVIDFGLLDHNRDGVISRSEIGDQLFSVYDADHNNILDQNEYAQIQAVTVRTPERRFVRSVDLDDDGYADVTEYTYDSVANRTKLYHFQRETNGLSAGDLMESPFSAIDSDHSATIARDEWQAAYMAQIAPLMDARPNRADNYSFNQ